MSTAQASTVSISPVSAFVLRASSVRAGMGLLRCGKWRRGPVCGPLRSQDPGRSGVAVGTPGLFHVGVVLFEYLHDLGLGPAFGRDFVPDLARGGLDRGPFGIRD